MKIIEDRNLLYDTWMSQAIREARKAEESEDIPVGCVIVYENRIIARAHNPSFLVSTYDPADMKALRNYVVNYFLEKQPRYDLFVPYADGATHSVLASKTNIMATSTHEKGIFYRVRVPEFIFAPLGIRHYVLAPGDPVPGEWTTIRGTGA